MEDLAGYLAEMGDRHTGILTDHDRETLSQAVVCGAGAGGVAGWSYQALARAGIRTFRIADPETFTASNANRQMACDSTTIGRNKAEATAETLRRINPAIDVSVLADGVTDKNLADFLDGGGIVLDGIDLGGLAMKAKLYRAARAAGIPVVSSPILGFGAALAVFDPHRSPSFDAFFGPVPPPGADPAVMDAYLANISVSFFSFAPRLDWKLQNERARDGKIPSIGTAAMFAGSFAATAVISVLCGRGRIPIVPTTIHIDLLEGRIGKTGPAKRWFARQGLRLVVRTAKKGR
jgi:molybdopterin/thiamine biosynthesis adenylyltransferase